MKKICKRVDFCVRGVIVLSVGKFGAIHLKGGRNDVLYKMWS